MNKILLSLLALTLLAQASDYERANSAAKEAFKNLDCDFGDCPKPAPKPKVIVQEKVVYKDRPVEVEKVIVKEKPVVVEKVVVKEKVVYRDRPAVVAKDVEVERIPAPVNTKQRVYNASFDIPIIGVTGTSFYSRTEYFTIEDDKVKARKQTYNSYLKTQSRATWASMKLKNGKSLFLSNFDATIPYFRESMTQVNFHVELPKQAIHNDKTVVSLPKTRYKNDSGYAEEYATCSFNGFIPTNSALQSEVKLNGNDYLDISCTIVLYNYKTLDQSINDEIQSMIQTESFNFIPTYRVFPPIRKGSKKAVLGSTLKKFVFASEIAE